MVVYEKIIRKHIMAELPFMATEEILMECVKAGGDRQELHEKIRSHSMESARLVKTEGKDNDLIERVKSDKAFSAIHAKIDSILAPENFTGRASEQTEKFIKEEIEPVLKANAACLGITAESERYVHKHHNHKTRYATYGGDILVFAASFGYKFARNYGNHCARRKRQAKGQRGFYSGAHKKTEHGGARFHNAAQLTE